MQPASIEWRVLVADDVTSAVFVPAGPTPNDVVFVCAHGAGGSMNDRGMIKLAEELHSRGLSVVRFNFMYKEKGLKRPDPMPVLESCFQAVVARVREELGPRVLIIGGRSMGGRAASMMAARGFTCDGLLMFAYPLHPAGRPEKLRDAHLASIKVPVLCFNGTRDALCTPELMEAALKTVTTRWDMHWLSGADHSFHVLKSSGRTDAHVLEEIGVTTDQWVAGLSTGVT
jgi:predicted alpha/beta-hydrolase family hydrolase